MKKWLAFLLALSLLSACAGYMEEQNLAMGEMNQRDLELFGPPSVQTPQEQTTTSYLALLTAVNLLARRANRQPADVYRSNSLLSSILPPWEDFTRPDYLRQAMIHDAYMRDIRKEMGEALARLKLDLER